MGKPSGSFLIPTCEPHSRTFTSLNYEASDPHPMSGCPHATKITASKKTDQMFVFPFSAPHRSPIAILVLGRRLYIITLFPSLNKHLPHNRRSAFQISALVIYTFQLFLVFLSSVSIYSPFPSFHSTHLILTAATSS